MDPKMLKKVSFWFISCSLSFVCRSMANRLRTNVGDAFIGENNDDHRKHAENSFSFSRRHNFYQDKLYRPSSRVRLEKYTRIGFLYFNFHLRRPKIVKHFSFFPSRQMAWKSRKRRLGLKWGASDVLFVLWRASDTEQTIDLTCRSLFEPNELRNS